ncbi:hypothetical protein [Azospirillum brasilense]|uniref:hypothetical protein n=1 Tax=Azospirillum brasilense TaxID=192 RepID=UPI0011784E12|nr:hypothetical protein [Azospirillum brasilense]
MEDRGGCFHWAAVFFGWTAVPRLVVGSRLTFHASLRCSFASAKKMPHLRKAETDEVCPQTCSSSVEKGNHFPVTRRAKPPLSNVMVAMTAQHATKPLTIGRRRRFWHEKS